LEGRLFTLDAQFLFDTVVLALSMLVLYTLLSYLLFNPVRDLLEKRKQRIADDREEAKRERAEALIYREEYEAKCKEENKEVQLILSEARKKASQNEEKIVREARDEATRIIERAHAEVELEKKQALDEMKQEMVTIATMMAQKIVTTSIDMEVQESLLDDTLKEMGEGTWQS